MHLFRNFIVGVLSGFMIARTIGCRRLLKILLWFIMIILSLIAVKFLQLLGYTIFHQ